MAKVVNLQWVKSLSVERMDKSMNRTPAAQTVGSTKSWVALWMGVVLCGALMACGDDTVIVLGQEPDNNDTADADDGNNNVPDGDDTGGFNGEVPVSNCKVPPTPDLSPLRVTRAFPNLTFTQPVYLNSAHDGSNRIFVVEKRGIIRVFANDQRAGASQVFLDLTDRVFARAGNDERGLLGLAFDPDFANNGYLWVNYTAQGPGTPTTISRFKVSDANPDVADPGSEVVALSFAQPYGNHNGGMLEFGPDGMLYISVGAGASSSDPDNNAQNNLTLLGKILRIDVKDMGNDGLYKIPPDNPYVNNANAREEIYATGLRNVWRFAFDDFTGQLWAADVGQRTIEEVDIIEKGGNYGWRPMEGQRCYNPQQDCESPLFLPGVAHYDHTVGLSITGGYVYRGDLLPELGGAYIYGDFANGQIFALTPSDGNAPDPPEGHEIDEDYQVIELALTNLKISSFGEDDNNELYIVDYASGGIYRLERAAPVDDFEPLPQTLTETGCFADVASQTLDPGLIPYSVNSQLWSDGAGKTRYFALPEGGKITFDETGAWDFPEKTVVVKNFYLKQGGQDQIIETRFMVKGAETWFGYSYQWNDDRTEAFLLPGAATKTFQTDGGPITWDYPSRAQCKACHTEASGQVLGLQTGQLNKDFAGPAGSPDNQIERLVAMNAFANPPAGDVSALAHYPDPYGDAPLADRARSYMQSNCAPCHLPNGTATSDIDLRYEMPLSQTRTCNIEPKEGDLGINGLLLISPGNAEASAMYQRTVRRDDDGMPPLASRVIDDPGTTLIRDWINSLSDCTP